MDANATQGMARNFTMRQRSTFKRRAERQNPGQQRELQKGLEATARGQKNQTTVKRSNAAMVKSENLNTFVESAKSLNKPQTAEEEDSARAGL